MRSVHFVLALLSHTIGYIVLFGFLSVGANSAISASHEYAYNYQHYSTVETMVGPTLFGLLWLGAILAIGLVAFFMAKDVMKTFGEYYPNVRLGWLGVSLTA